MYKSFSAEKSAEISAQVMKRIQSEELTPIPENYELLYVYYAGTNTDILHAIELLEKNKQKITDKVCQELHQRFLEDRSESEEVRRAGDKVQETIREVTGAVAEVKTATIVYNKTLMQASGELEKDLDREALGRILGQIKNGTGDIMKKNMALEKELVRSVNTMKDLKRDLELVRKEALTDSLTNVANRKSFDAALDRIAREAEEMEQAFSLVMMDIDHFKSFNDNFGHQVGDQVLKLVAKVLTDGVKGRDVVARYGGEEFGVILPATNMPGAMKVANMLRQAVANKDVVNKNTGEKMGKITMSGGVAEYMPGEDLEKLIERADAALYTAKHNGRDQVAAAPPPGRKKQAG